MRGPVAERIPEARLLSGEWWKDEDLPLCWEALMPGGPMWVDVGFGQGEFLLAMAQARPGWRFVGIDRFREGHRKLLAATSEGGCPNLVTLVGNAFICGALSNPHDRYQSRVVWIAVLAVGMVLADRGRFGEGMAARR